MGRVVIRREKSYVTQKDHLSELKKVFIKSYHGLFFPVNVNAIKVSLCASLRFTNRELFNFDRHKRYLTDRLIAHYVEFSLDRKIEHFAFGKHTVVCLFV